MGGFGSGRPPKVKRTQRAKLHTPETLPEGAAAYFRMLARRAGEHGLTQADVPMLAQLATALWIADQAALRMARDGLLMTDQSHGDGTELRKHPAFTIWRNAVTVADTLAKQFGMTPAARARLGLEQESGAPSLAEVLFGEAATHGEG
jgi:P27 family predicted phage terminase small subunit